MKEAPIDLGNDSLNQMDISDAELPDRRFTELGKKMEEEEKLDDSTLDTPGSTMIPIELLQEKTDEIERLQELLDKDKESMEKLQKQVSDLHEAVKIAEQRTENAIAEREKFSDKNREMIQKISSLREDLKDKELNIEEFLAKMNLLKGENRIVSESKEMLQKKIDHIYENNILINKEGKSSSNKEEEEQNKEQSTFMNNIQEEVRKLHFQLKQKDTIINKLTKLVEKKGENDNEYGNEDDSKAEIDKILHSNVEPEQSKG